MDPVPVVIPETQYALSGDVHVAYRVWGDGPYDIVLVPPLFFSILHQGHAPYTLAGFERLSSHARVITFDKRGTGGSDPVAGAPSLEERMDDVRAVMDATRSSCAALLGVADGGAMSILFAATYPERTFGLALFRAKPRYVWAPDFPWAPTRQAYEQETERLVQERLLTDAERLEGERRRAAARGYLDEVPGSVDEYRLWARLSRLAAPPGTVRALRRMNMEIDVRDVLASVRVPTLLMYRPPDFPDAAETQDGTMARYMAERIPVGARLAEITEDQFFVTDVLPHLIDFLGDAWSARDRTGREQRVLATVLFTDIVGASERAAELGDRAWRDLLGQHHAAVRRQLVRFRGVEIDTAGDGFFASFDGPARAISCACAVVETVRELGIEVRAGLHTGECEVIDGKVAGIAVHTGARVAAQAQPGEVLVSRTVKDLVAGSGLAFQDRGQYELKGIPGEWRLYAVDTSSEIDRERPALAGD